MTGGAGVTGVTGEAGRASGARSTQPLDPEDVESLTAKCVAPARHWAETADELWHARPLPGAQRDEVPVPDGQKGVQA